MRYKADNKYMVFHYNCWRYDYYEEPSVAIIAAMLEQIEKEESLFGQEIDGVLKAGWGKAKEVIGEIAGEFSKNKIGINLVEVVKEIKEDKDKIDNEAVQFDNLFSFRKTLDNTRKKIKELAKEKTLIIVVDELDRCLPEYAIKVLERLHHLFAEINNVIVVLAIDSGQLVQSVLQIYGHETQVDDYLKKFIDFTLVLDKGKGNGKFKIKYNSYFNKFNDLNEQDEQKFEELFLEFFNIVDIRTQEKLISKAELIHNLVYTDKKLDRALLGIELMYSFFAYKQNSENIQWILEINKATYPVLEESVGKELISYLKILQKSVSDKDNKIIKSNTEFSILKGSFIDKIFWILAALYNEVNYKMCHTYYYEEAENLNEEVKIAKQFIELAKL
ncbi:MAG: P-loop NTPase fold protein [Aminipila sp.]